MSTVGAAMRRLVVEDGAVGGRVFRRRAPDSPTWPFCTFLDPISEVQALAGSGAVMAWERQLQLSLWQKAREEDPALPERLQALLDHARLDTEDGRQVWGVRVTSLSDVSDPDPLVVHHALTLTVRREAL